MAGVLPLAQGMATLMEWIIACGCGIPPPAIRSMFIVVIAILCMPWHGRLTANAWLQQARVVMCRCGRRCKFYLSIDRARSPLASSHGEEWRVLVWGLGWVVPVLLPYARQD